MFVDWGEGVSWVGELELGEEGEDGEEVGVHEWFLFFFGPRKE